MRSRQAFLSSGAPASGAVPFGPGFAAEIPTPKPLSLAALLRILVVEDSPLVQKMYALVFPRREHQLTAVDHGRKALYALETSDAPFDLILLDLRMPDMDGVEFIREARAIPTLSRIPIVLTTAEQDQSVLMIQARALGVTAVVHKPWKPQELRALVQSIVKQRVA